MKTFPSDLKPIETQYNGYRFRSRLEARWAVFFDSLSIPYEYEKEGFDLGDAGWYLPDFWLPQQRCWVEIRPADQYDFDRPCCRLAGESQTRVLYVAGNPWPMEHSICIYEPFDDPYVGRGATFTGCDGPGSFATGRRDSRELWVSSVEHWGAMCLNPITDDERYPLTDSPEIMAAFTAARKARFEHGESGVHA